MIEWLKERYTINEKLIELVNEIEIEKEWKNAEATKQLERDD